MVSSLVYRISNVPGCFECTHVLTNVEISPVHDLRRCDLRKGFASFLRKLSKSIFGGMLYITAFSCLLRHRCR